MRKKRSKFNQDPAKSKLKSSGSCSYTSGFGSVFAEPILKSIKHSTQYSDHEVKPFVKYASEFKDNPTRALVALHNMFVKLNGTEKGMEKFESLGGSPGKLVKHLKKAKGVATGDFKALEEAITEIIS